MYTKGTSKSMARVTATFNLLTFRCTSTVKTSHKYRIIPSRKSLVRNVNFVYNVELVFHSVIWRTEMIGLEWAVFSMINQKIDLIMIFQYICCRNLGGETRDKNRFNLDDFYKHKHFIFLKRMRWNARGLFLSLSLLYGSEDTISSHSNNISVIIETITTTTTVWQLVTIFSKCTNSLIRLRQTEFSGDLSRHGLTCACVFESSVQVSIKT